MDPRQVEGYDGLKDVTRHEAGAHRVGVYEVWWDANTRYPERPASQRLAIAEAVVADLLAAGDVRLVAGPWTATDEQLAEVGDPDTVLRDWATWVPRADRVVWIEATA